MDAIVFLNDRETFTQVNGCIIVDKHGIAYDLQQVWDRIPIIIRERCRIGLAQDVVKLK